MHLLETGRSTINEFLRMCGIFPVLILSHVSVLSFIGLFHPNLLTSLMKAASGGNSIKALLSSSAVILWQSNPVVVD